MPLSSRTIQCVLAVFFLLVPRLFGQDVLPLKGPDGETYLGLGSLQRVQYDPVYDAMVTGSSLGIFRWDAQTGQIKSRDIDYKKLCYDFIVAPDGRYLFKFFGDHIEKETRDMGHVISTITSTEILGYRVLSLSRDGKLLIVYDIYNKLHVWNADTMKEHISLEEVVTDVDQAIISPNGNYLLTTKYDYSSANYSNTVTLWSLKTGQKIADLAIRGDYNPPDIKNAVFSPDDQYVITYGYSAKTQVWSAETGKLASPPTSAVDEVLFLKDNTYLVMQSDKIDLYQVGKSPVQKSFKPDKGHYFYQMIQGGNDDAVLFFSSKGSDSSPDDKLSIWDRTVRMVIDSVSLKEPLTPLFVEPKHNWMVCNQSGTVIKVADVDSGKIFCAINGFTQSMYSSSNLKNFFPFTENGEEFVQTGIYGIADFYKANTNDFQWSVPVESSYPPISLSADGRLAAYSDLYSDNRSINVIDTLTQRNVAIIKMGASATNMREFALSPDAAFLLVYYEDRLELWDVFSAKKIRDVLPFIYPSSYRFIIFSPDGKQILLPSDTGYQSQNLKTGEAIQSYSTSLPAGFSGVDISKDSALIALGASSGVDIFDFKTGENIKRLGGFIVTPCESINYPILVRFSPDHQFVLLASSSKSILMNFETGKVVKEFHGYPNTLMNVIFTPEGNQIVFAFSDGNRVVWDIYAATHPVRTISYKGQSAIPEKTFKDTGKYRLCG